MENGSKLLLRIKYNHLYQSKHTNKYVRRPKAARSKQTRLTSNLEVEEIQRTEDKKCECVCVSECLCMDILTPHIQSKADL